MNLNEKLPEYLLLFIDDKLKNGVKGVSLVKKNQMLMNAPTMHGLIIIT